MRNNLPTSSGSMIAAQYKYLEMPKIISNVVQTPGEKQARVCRMRTPPLSPLLLLDLGSFTEYQDQSSQLLPSVFPKRKDNNKIAGPSHNCSPSKVLIFTLELVQDGGKFV